MHCFRIWHDNSGKSPSWYFSRMQVTDMQTQDQYFFINDQWLALEYDDGMVRYFWIFSYDMWSSSAALK